MFWQVLEWVAAGILTRICYQSSTIGKVFARNYSTSESKCCLSSVLAIYRKGWSLSLQTGTWHPSCWLALTLYAS